METAVKIATSAASATSAFDEDTRALYTDLIETALSEAARKVFGMLPQNYQFQGPSFKKGQAVGEVIGEVKAVLTVLEARGLQPSAEQRERILTTTDPVQVHHLVRKAVTAQSVDELFE